MSLPSSRMIHLCESISISRITKLGIRICRVRCAESLTAYLRIGEICFPGRIPQTSLRFFLWREDPTSDVVVHKYNRHLIGVLDLSTCANFALKRKTQMVIYQHSLKQHRCLPKLFTWLMTLIHYKTLSKHIK